MIWEQNRFLVSTQNQRCFNVKFRRWFNVDKMTLFRRWNTVTSSTLISRLWYLKHHDIRTKLFLESTQIQRCFNVDFYRWINVDKSTLNQRGHHVDRCRNVISTYVNVESTLSVCWVILLLNDLKKIVPTPRTWHIHNIHNLFSAFRISNLQ